MSKYQAVAASLALGLTSLLPLQPANAATPDIDAVCAAKACRDGGYKLALRLDKEHFTTITIARAPYVLEDGGILIFPGETIAVQYDLENGQPVRPRFVRRFAPTLPMQVEKDGKPVANPADSAFPALKLDNGQAAFDDLPPNTVIVSYGQMEGKPDMMMTINHNLPKRLKVAATMHVPVKATYDVAATSTCPIQPRLTLLEHWPHPIGPMILRAPRLLADNDDGACT